MYLDFINIPEFKPKEIQLPEPPFLSYNPDLQKIKQYWQQSGMFKNILVIGHGGSINSFLGINATLGIEKNVHILSTTDPEYISELRESLPKHDTLVIAISKSGQTVTQIEALMSFIDYPLLFITSPKGALHEIGKRAKATIVEFPAVGGRFTAFTEVALVPAAICGIDIERLVEGGRKMYKQYHFENVALQAAQIFFELENQGIVDVFMPVYSHSLFGFHHLVVQLCHESFGKNGKGQTYFATEAPESQHHTNQRVFGGRRNLAGFFMHVENFRKDMVVSVPTAMHSIPIRDGELFTLHKLPLSYSMQSEYAGTWEHAKDQGIPAASLGVTVIDPEEVGQFIAFWQMYAVYSSILREVNPFDQPQVENSKTISWNKRREFRLK